MGYAIDGQSLMKLNSVVEALSGMNEVLVELNANANLLTAIATGVLAILTVGLLAENRYLRKAGSSPAVVTYLRPHPDGHGGIQFVIENVGRGPAFDVDMKFECDEADFEGHKVLLTNDATRRPLTVLPQEEKIVALFGISFELYGGGGSSMPKPLKPFSTNLQYTDIFGRKHTQKFRLDIRQFAGLRGIFDKPNDRKAAQSLEKIEKHLAKLVRDNQQPTAFVDTTGVSDDHVQKAKTE